MSFHSGNELIDPYLIFEKARLRPGMRVADLGCGRTGHLIFPAALVVGERGVIYAVDVLKDVLETIKKRAKDEGLLNIHTVWSDLELVGATAIPEKSLDVAFLVNTLCQANNRHGIMEETKRLLKNKARLIIVDWIRKGLSFSPPDERFINFDDVKRWASLHGFAVQEEFGVGRYHKGIVLFRHI